jgi:putative ABC transport system permease protein
MYKIALKILVGNTGKYVGMIAGVFFAALVITQQLSIFVGIMSRTIGFLSDVRLPDIWVTDPMVQYINDVKPLQDTKLYQVRGVEGVQWAVPMYKGMIRARLPSGQFQNCDVIGLDDATLIGGPPVMVEGAVADLRRADGVIIDVVAAKTKLAHPPAYPGGPRKPLQVGDVLELNDNRAVIVGIAQTTRSFQSQPIVYTTYSRATSFAPRERKLLSFILVKAKDGVPLSALTREIAKRTGLAARTADEFMEHTIDYYLKNTGIPINFGIAVLLGFVVGTAVAGQTFYSFTVDNIRYFGTLKAMGASSMMLVKMVLLQSVVVGLVGYGLGVGMASLTRVVSANSELAFKFPWQLLAISAVAVTLICMLSALFSIRKVIKLEPAIVFKG